MDVKRRKIQRTTRSLTRQLRHDTMFILKKICNDSPLEVILHIHCEYLKTLHMSELVLLYNRQDLQDYEIKSFKSLIQHNIFYVNKHFIDHSNHWKCRFSSNPGDISHNSNGFIQLLSFLEKYNLRLPYIEFQLIDFGQSVEPINVALLLQMHQLTTGTNEVDSIFNLVRLIELSREVKSQRIWEQQISDLQSRDIFSKFTDIAFDDFSTLDSPGFNLDSFKHVKTFYIGIGMDQLRTIIPKIPRIKKMHRDGHFSSLQKIQLKLSTDELSSPNELKDIESLIRQLSLINVPLEIELEYLSSNLTADQINVLGWQYFAGYLSSIELFVANTSQEPIGIDFTVSMNYLSTLAYATNTRSLTIISDTHVYVPVEVFSELSTTLKRIMLLGNIRISDNFNDFVGSKLTQLKSLYLSSPYQYNRMSNWIPDSLELLVFENEYSKEVFFEQDELRTFTTPLPISLKQFSWTHSQYEPIFQVSSKNSLSLQDIKVSITFPEDNLNFNGFNFSSSSFELKLGDHSNYQVRKKTRFLIDLRKLEEVETIDIKAFVILIHRLVLMFPKNLEKLSLLIPLHIFDFQLPRKLWCLDIFVHDKSLQSLYDLASTWHVTHLTVRFQHSGKCIRLRQIPLNGLRLFNLKIIGDSEDPMDIEKVFLDKIPQSLLVLEYEGPNQKVKPILVSKCDPTKSEELQLATKFSFPPLPLT